MNEQSKQDVQSRAKEDKEHRDKDLVDKNNRISSLQQMYKLLQSEHDDFKEDCSKVKANNLESINGLERKVKSLQNEVAQLKREREKDVEHWKVRFKYYKYITNFHLFSEFFNPNPKNFFLNIIYVN